MIDDTDWTDCANPKCDNTVNPRRVEVIVRDNRPGICLRCGDIAAKAGPPVRIIEMPKSNDMVVRADADIRGLASSHKGNRQPWS